MVTLQMTFNHLFNQSKPLQIEHLTVACCVLVYPDCGNDFHAVPTACSALIHLSSALLVFCSRRTDWLVTDQRPSTITWLEKVSTPVPAVLLFDWL